jgi:hypothetical protein
VPLTVRVAAALLLIPAPAEPPVTFPVTVTLADAPVIEIPKCEMLLPPVTFPVILTVAAPLMSNGLELLPAPPVRLPVRFRVPVPATSIDRLEEEVGPLMVPVIDSVPLEDNATAAEDAVVFVNAAATLAELPSPRLGVVTQLVVVAP